MPLFTLILDYDGGTYISQRSAPTCEQAFAEWASNIVLEEIAIGASMAVAEAFEDWEEETTVQIDGLTNVWCVSGSNDTALALLTIVRTEE